MAGLRLVAQNTAAVALAAATQKTLVQVNAPAQQRLIGRRVGIFFDGASTTAVPVLVELRIVSTAGTGTALTISKIVSSDPETIQSTATENHTVEGTNGTLIDSWLIHPQMGIDLTLAMAQEYVFIGGSRFALKVTAPAVVNARGKIFFDE